jgi:hypothetical protein
LRRLRTTPAKKPRTECRCQPVACMIAAIVAPFGDESRAMTRDCFEPDFDVSAFRLPGTFCPDLPAVAAGFDWAGTWRVPLGAAVRGVGLAAERDARRCSLAARFFADFDIEILHSVCGLRRTTEAPSRRSNRPATSSQLGRRAGRLETPTARCADPRATQRSVRETPARLRSWRFAQKRSSVREKMYHTKMICIRLAMMRQPYPKAVQPMNFTASWFFKGSRSATALI